MVMLQPEVMFTLTGDTVVFMSLKQKHGNAATRLLCVDFMPMNLIQVYLIPILNLLVNIMTVEQWLGSMMR